MKTSTMTVKGQVTIPKEFRDAFGWKAGDPVAFLRDDKGVHIVRAERRGRGREVVESLKQARWNRKLSTDRLIAMTRGKQ